jgi:hypothetical protein
MRGMLLRLLTCVSVLLATLPGIGPTQAQEDEPLGEVTLNWAMTTQERIATTDAVPQVVRDQLTATYQGQWTWQVLSEYPGDLLELDEGHGNSEFSAYGGGSEELQDQGKTSCTWYEAGQYRVRNAIQWAYRPRDNKGNPPGVSIRLVKEGDDMYYTYTVGLPGGGVEMEGKWSKEESSCGQSWSDRGECDDSSGCSPFEIGSLLSPRFEQGLEGKVRMEEWGFSASGTATYSSGPGSGPPGMNYQASATYQWTLTYSREPSNLEAVIIIPDGYDKWLPEAGADEETKGNELTVEVELRYKDRPKDTPIEEATFEFNLVATSQEPGVCLNKPAKDKAKDTFDLKIDQGANPDLRVENGGQSASTKKPGQGARVTITSYDWGAYGRLWVRAKVEGRRPETLTAHLEGEPGETRLIIPKDDNDNHIADYWEEKQELMEEATWDGAWTPAGQKTDGDGISLYEKYRGFELGIGNQLKHEQLDAPYKYIFMYDPDGVVLRTMTDPRGMESSPSAVTKCRIVFVDDQHWTGEGAAGSKKRIVNFNTSGFGHAVDQHALDVRLDNSTSPLDPADWAKQHGVTDRTLGLTVRGIAYGDQSFGDYESPGGTFRIVIFGYNMARTIWNTVEYHTPGDPESVELNAEVARYMTDNMGKMQEAYAKMLARVLSHEVGHGLGIDEHSPTTAGSKSCVMRYLAWEDCPPNANDRFELACRSPWPDRFGGAADDLDCWGQVGVSDRR